MNYNFPPGTIGSLLAAAKADQQLQKDAFIPAPQAMDPSTMSGATGPGQGGGYGGYPAGGQGGGYGGGYPAGGQGGPPAGPGAEAAGGGMPQGQPQPQPQGDPAAAAGGGGGEDPIMTMLQQISQRLTTLEQGGAGGAGKGQAKVKPELVMMAWACQQLSTIAGQMGLTMMPQEVSNIVTQILTSGGMGAMAGGMGGGMGGGMAAGAGGAPGGMPAGGAPAGGAMPAKAAEEDPALAAVTGGEPVPASAAAQISLRDQAHKAGALARLARLRG